MRVFVTGATGYIGSAVAHQLLTAGYSVVGLARTAQKAQQLREKGVEPLLGDLEDLPALVAGAQSTEATVHCASPMTMDFAYRERIEKTAVETMLAAVARSQKAFLYTSDQLIYGDSTGKEAPTEETPLNPLPFVAWRPAVEQLVLAYAHKGVRAMVVRAVAVFGEGKDHLTPLLIETARKQGYAFYIGDGGNPFSFVHVADLAALYVTMLEQGTPGLLLNAADDHLITTRQLAEGIASAAGIAGKTRSITLEEATHLLGPFAQNLTFSLKASPAKARQVLGWQARQPSILEQLQASPQQSDSASAQ